MSGVAIVLADFDLLVPPGVEAPEESEAGNEFYHLCEEFEENGIEIELLVVGCEEGNPFSNDELVLDDLPDESQQRMELAQEMAEMLPAHVGTDFSSVAAVVVSPFALDPSGKLKQVAAEHLTNLSAAGVPVYCFSEAGQAVKGTVPNSKSIDSIEEFANEYYE